MVFHHLFFQTGMPTLSIPIYYGSRTLVKLHRKMKDMKGIKINEMEIKIIQTADDTTMFAEDSASLKKV